MRDVRIIGGGRGLCGGPGRKVDGVFPGRPQSFRHQRRLEDDCNPGRGGMAEQGAEHFMVKWIAAEEARGGLRHAVVHLNVTGRTKKRIAKAGRFVLVRSPLLTSHKWRELVSSRRLVCVWFADAMASFSGVTFVFKKNLNVSKPSEHPPQVEECLKV